MEKIEFVATGGPYTITIDHKNSLASDQTFHLILSYESGSSENLYWVGGDNLELSNPANYSYESGGVAISSFQASNQTLIFDNNSFASSGNMLTLSGDLTVDKIVYLSDYESTLDLGSFDLTMAGDVSFNDKLSIVGNGEVVVSSTNASISSSTALKDIDIRFSNVSGDWDIFGDFEAQNVIIESGNVTFSDSEISVVGITFKYSS